MLHVDLRRGLRLSVHKHPGHYTLHNVVGRGATSVVFDATNDLTGESCAVKIIECSTQKAQERVNRELAILQSLHHSGILEFREVMRFGSVAYIVTEYCTGGELFDAIMAGKFRERQTRVRVFCEILLAIRYLHHQGISHQDIKPENVMLDRSGNPKLIDFGFARGADGGGFERGGTLIYIAPELLSAERCDTQLADIWSLGVLLIALDTGMLPYPNVGNKQLVKLVKKGQLCYPKRMDPEMKDLAKKMTAMNPKERPTIDEVLASPLFADLEQAGLTPDCA
jgi:serine/threonine protein kinase